MNCESVSKATSKDYNSECEAIGLSLGTGVPPETSHEQICLMMVMVETFVELNGTSSSEIVAPPTIDVATDVSSTSAAGGDPAEPAHESLATTTNTCGEDANDKEESDMD